MSTSTRQWLSRRDECHSMRMAIGDLVRAAAAPGWSRLVVHRAQVGAHAVTTVTRDGHEITVEGMDEPFQRLRELSFKAGAGTWLTCELTFTSSGRGYTGRVDSLAPPFEDVPGTAAMAELTTFPRDEPPGWLLAALPTAAPFGLPTTYGERYDSWHGVLPGDHRPPPISGELDYVPSTTMTARVFGEGEERDHPMVYLAAQENDPEAGHLLISCYQQAYWVAREGIRGTGEGIRSITLDGTALRLELTTEAADLLETETAFEVRLDLPPETVGRLRAALPGMLCRAAQPPELIGF